MRTVIAYVLVVPLVQFCSTAGVYLGGGPVALLLVWAPVQLRTKIAGVCGGIAGVLLAVAFGYGIFRFVIGPESFTIGAFLASTLPLLILIRNDFLQSQRVKESREQLLRTIAERHDEHTVKAMTEATCSSHGSMVVGEIAGLALVAIWFFCR